MDTVTEGKTWDIAGGGKVSGGGSSTVWGLGLVKGGYIKIKIKIKVGGLSLTNGQGWIDQDLNTLPWETSCPSEERYMYRHLKWKVVKSVSQSKNERAVACKLQNFETCSTRGCNRGCYQKNDDNQLLSNLFSSLRVAEAC